MQKNTKNALNIVKHENYINMKIIFIIFFKFTKNGHQVVQKFQIFFKCIF